jgi:hypothetical protein
MLTVAGFAAPASAQVATTAATPAAATPAAATPAKATQEIAGTPAAAATTAASQQVATSATASTPVAATTTTATAPGVATTVAAAIPVASITAITATPLAVTARPTSDASAIAPAAVLKVVPTPAATVLQPSEPGRAAILSTAPRPVFGTTPPTGTGDVRPAVTHAGLWPMVWAKQTGNALSEQEECVAIAVYHEARGEPLDGQLAVAEVIMNRAASGRYPASWCEVVKQPWQFSFVNPRTGRMPGVNRSSASWAYAQAITRIAVGQFADALPGDVLWYHADYVAPSWGRRLAKLQKIGAHIFYRAS